MDVKKIGVSHEDDRGVIIDILSHVDVDAVTLITFKLGKIRANHFHKETTQWNYVISGKILLVTQLGDGPRVETVLEQGDLAATYPDEKHALKALEETTLLVITKGPRGGKEYESDTFRLDAPLITG